MQHNHAIQRHLGALRVLLKVLPQVWGEQQTVCIYDSSKTEMSVRDTCDLLPIWTDVVTALTPQVGRKNNLCRNREFNPESKLLTGDPDGCLAALGGPQVAPGDAQTPVVLRAVKVLHLLPGHVDHHFTDLQPYRQNE